MATAGANLPTTTSSGAAHGSANTWTNPNNAQAIDGVFATASSGMNPTNDLACTGFGFSIPSGATINGIQATASGKVSTGTGFFSSLSSLIKGGVTQGTFGSNGGNNFGTTQGTCTLGGVSSLWGTTWTDTNINASNFGVNASFGKTGKGTKTISIDYIQLTITYTAASGGVFTQTRIVRQAVNRASTY